MLEVAVEHARVPADLLCVTIHADVRNVGMALLCVRVRYGTYVAGPKQKRLGAVQSEKRVGRTAFFRAVEWKEERCGVGVGYQSRVPSMPCLCYIVPYLATIPRVALTASVFEDAKDTAAACVCYNANMMPKTLLQLVSATQCFWKSVHSP